MAPSGIRICQSNRSGKDRYLRHKKERKFLPDWKPLVSAFERNVPYLRRAVGEGHSILRLFVWKHHFSPIDTSNVVAWLNTPANLLPPSRPVINGITHEILARIFSFVVHSDCTKPKDHHSKVVSYSSVSSGSSPTTPLILGHVCSFWRNFVRDTPNLWSTITVYSPRPKHVGEVSFWLQRSANCPLDLRLEQFFLPDPSSYAIAELFVTEAHRWKRISFTVSFEAPFTKLGLGDTPILEDYRIRLDKWNRTRAQSFIQALQSSPVLHTINWGKSICAQVPAETPWHQLSNISLQNLELSEVVMDGLSGCASLKVLHLRYMWRSNTHNLSIVLPQLERLVCESNESCPWIFDYLTLPSLNDLHWLSFFQKTDTQTSPLLSMIDRSGCILKTLAVNRHTFHLVSTRIVAGVESFHVFDDAINSNLLDLIKRPEQCVMPALQHLFLETCASDDGTLSAVILSRFPELKTVQVCLDRRNYPKDILTLGWLKKDGLTVDIQEHFFQTHVVSYSHLLLTPDLDSDSDTFPTPTLRFPDLETLWT